MFRCIRDLDPAGAMALWKHERPHMPQPQSVQQATVMLHYARCSITSMPEALRFYSHCWLRDIGVWSPLPDHLKPKAERMYPVKAGMVGVCVGMPGRTPTAHNVAVRNVMLDAVKEAYADGHAAQQDIVKARMLEKRARFHRSS